MSRLQWVFVRAFRFIVARPVCAARGHDFTSGRDSLNTWTAYQCIRCGALSRPLESLPPPPDDEDSDDYYDWRGDHDADHQRDLQEQYERAQQWFRFARWPRWV